jgi:hypothetical protein
MTTNALVAPNLPIGTSVALLDTNQGSIQAFVQDVSPSAAGIAPFRGTFYVDPLYTGAVHTGSESNPFITIADAFAAAALQGLTRGIIFLAPGANTVENVTFPLTGEWEIASQMTLGNVGNVTIAGNVDISASASARRALTGVTVTGNVTGNCSAGTQRIIFTCVTVGGTTTLTQTGAGVQRLGTRGGTSAPGSGANLGYSQFTGAVSVAGTFWGSWAAFQTSVAVTATSSFDFCDMPPTTSAAGAVAIWMSNCSNTVGGPLAFTSTSGNMQLRPDPATLSELQRVGCVLTGTVSIKCQSAASFRGVQVTNVGASPISQILPAGLMVCEACLTLLAGTGTATGNATLNVIYTDATGTLVTEAVTTALNVGGAVGSKARGTLPFSQNGATAVSFSVTGITGATGLSYQCDVAVRQAS